MIKPKIKMCAGFDGNEHEAYIYKNIGGKKYCKSCTQKLEPAKTVFKVHVIKKISDKQRDKLEERKALHEKDLEFYLDVWRTRFGIDKNGNPYGDYPIKRPKCEVCDVSLSYVPNLCYFHHIMEKRNYPEYRHKKFNIAIVCSSCHNEYETMPDTVPYLRDQRKSLINLLDQKETKNE